jgi:uncharacterized iron-regulated protein
LKYPVILYLLASACLTAASPAASAADATHSCEAHVAQWLDPASGKVIAPQGLFARIADSKIVLLGEVHTSKAHHIWQHYMLAALHSRKPDTIVGMEMLPRRVQPALDAWSAGKLDEASFLQQSEWADLWGYDPALYLPLLRLARLERMPVVALNIDRRLVSRVAEQGWQSIPAGDRLGLSDPAPASAEYRQSLAKLYAYKQRLHRHDADAESGGGESNLQDILQSDDFNHFVDAQQTWDRAMAEALAEAHRLDPGAQVVGIVGRGHLEYSYGIPSQLADMGIEDVSVLLPLDSDDDCVDLPANLADAVFVVDAPGEAAQASRPRLGVMIESSDAGVRVTRVVDDSVAARAGIRSGDVIRQAAGFNVESTRQLVEIVQRQAAGTWLPLRVLRDQRGIDLVARFPQHFD